MRGFDSSSLSNRSFIHSCDTCCQLVRILNLCVNFLLFVSSILHARRHQMEVDSSLIAEDPLFLSGRDDDDDEEAAGFGFGASHSRMGVVEFGGGGDDEDEDGSKKKKKKKKQANAGSFQGMGECQTSSSCSTSISDNFFFSFCPHFKRIVAACVSRSDEKGISDSDSDSEKGDSDCVDWAGFGGHGKNGFW